jgi:hypothetical protein
MNNEEPIIYGGTDLSIARRKAPASVLEKCKKIRCYRCKKKCVVVEETFAEMRQLSEKTGRKLITLCLRCTKLEMENEETAIISLGDDEIESQLEKFEAEQN